MKTMKNILLFFGFVSVLSLIACDIPIALGEKLDITGPVVNFISPQARKAVKGEFDIEGNVSDNSGIKSVLLRVSKDRVDLARQWLYEDGTWKISEDSGSTWAALPGAIWNGNNKAGDFKIPIDMTDADDGEYLFILQAWDIGDFSDDNSIKMRVLIVDSNPPKVSVSNPVLYDLYDSEFAELRGLTGLEWQDPSKIIGGKLQTREFLIQWQIDDSHDLWSFDLRFYDWDVDVDGFPETPLPDTHYYYFHQKDLEQFEPPDNLNPLDSIKPNGSVIVPALDGNIGDYTDVKGQFRGTIAKQVTTKTVLQVVAVCYDVAGNVSQEKRIGYFIYWPEADVPWITYSGMENLAYYGYNYSNPSANIATVVNNIKNGNGTAINLAYMIYPGREITANAFHYHGLKEVEYTLDRLTEDTGLMVTVQSEILSNPPRVTGGYSTSFPWKFKPPLRPGIYRIIAIPKSIDNKPGLEYEAVFRVQDTTFPNFPDAPAPAASEPFFMFLNAANNALTITGTVSDADDIESLCLVWINPRSREFASQAQLEYFRDQSYAGWREAVKLSPGSAAIVENTSTNKPTVTPPEIYPFDEAAPNKLWRLSPSNKRTGGDSRTYYDYSVTINLTQLNIGLYTGEFEDDRPSNLQNLSSQVFLLRVANPDGKATVITYTPQGDTVIPKIGIESVTILRGANNLGTFYPSTDPRHNPNLQIPKFLVNDIIRINGNWEEDTAKKLPAENYLYPNMSFTINGNTFPASANSANITITRTLTSPGTGANSNITTVGRGTFIINATVGATGSAAHRIQLSDMMDTLVVGARVKDFGGNEAEDSASWLVQTDVLELLRISSDAPDITYKVGDTIDIFLEFNKPVMLKNRSTAPVLTLNTTGGTAGTATFRTSPAQNTENTRQYFTYRVEANQTITVNPATNPNGFLDVTGLSGGDSGNANSDYRFSWVHAPPSGSPEEIRILSPTTTLPTGTSYVVNNLPTASGNSKSLIAGKEIKVDTVAPTLVSITSTQSQGWHRAGAQIYINATFSKPVNIDTTSNTTVPYLTFVDIANTPASGVGVTNRTLSDVRVVNNNTISFVYNVAAGNNTPNGALTVNNIVGTITDIPGTAFTMTPGAGNLTQRTITGVYIDNAAPSVPTVSIRTPGAPTTIITSITGTTTSTSATSGGNGQAAWDPATPPATIVNLSNIYLDELTLDVAYNATGTDANRDRYRLEYSINYGKDWQLYSQEGAAGTRINWGAADPNGTYQITARQIDAAGNVSNWSRPVVFNWDRGALVTSINSLSPNDTYTAYTDTDGTVKQYPSSIDITLFFRKDLVFASAPSIRLNTNNGAEKTTNIAATTGTSATGVTETYANNRPYRSLTFTYNIALGDSTGTGATDYLKVTSFQTSANSVFDATPTASAINVTSRFLMPTTAGSKLEDVKQIKVDATALTSVAPTFDTIANGAAVNADNTLSTKLKVNFNQSLIRGSGDITIIQTAASYRLPTVLTETERTRYRSEVGEDLFDAFYTRGTNGLDGNNPDTSTKYILNYSENPNSVTPSTTPGTAPGTVAYLAERFRQAEKLTFAATANVVSLANNNSITNSQLVVDISGTSSLRVPGGTYDITIPAGFVRSNLNRPSTAVTAALTAEGVARPFIRIKKAQETITAVNTATSATVPRIVATQPLETKAKIDTRTPMTGANARMRYVLAESTQTGSNTNWWRTNPVNNLPNIATDPSYTSGQTLANNAEITLGNTDYEGYIGRIRAVAFSGTTTSSAFSNDAAYRTVFTYQIINMTAGDGRQLLAVGDQIWLRGGDAIGSSSVPGYPLTWADDWNDLNESKKRAGIRLMTLQGTATTTNSTWKWVSWEISVETVFDIILGRRETTDTDTLAQIQQYGPKQYAYQAAGWTSWKERYSLIPGTHRSVTTTNPTTEGDFNPSSKGALNFSGTWSSRPSPGATWTHQP